MDGSGFDNFVRQLATRRSRRSVLRGLIGGGAALAAARTTGAMAQDKVTICHFPPGNPANVQVISVGSSALDAHLAHGDFAYTDCCGDGECSWLTDQCNTGVCSQGTCMAVPANEGGACDDGDACTEGDFCSGGVCAGSAVNCSEYDTTCTEGLCDSVNGCYPSPINDGMLCEGDCWVCDDGYCNKDDYSFCGACELCQEAYCEPSSAQNGAECVTEDGEEGTCSEGICEPPFGVPLFNCGPGYACPTGATTFDPGGPLDPNSSAQALAACEACYGVGNCYLESADCAGPGWGPNPPYSFTCGDAYFGYTGGCSGGPGRVWPICSSWADSDYGDWGTNACEGFRIAAAEASEDRGPTAPIP